ncbi:hypothetical protein Athai_09020 [Actinocatenispora thailandica]|uniref:V-type ATP synthase subunit I n=1 Tax=Actinocatenispora thailandica TaxID=227318 RepID=A0A7R7DKJ2_9ACTN|nr:V-type ATPase 116kDa subunit family protein [Actinocatenispora thailandica]BCJ33399.1 hypothetical protein Athai_09020 [Actinocatenispora thailandica]
MRWSDLYRQLGPVSMRRIAIVAPAAAMRSALAVVGAAGVVDVDEPPGRDGTGPAGLPGYLAAAVRHDQVAALLGWCPRGALRDLACRLRAVGAAPVPLPTPPGTEPPTLLPAGPVRRSVAPLVGTYQTVAYPDVDPTVLAGVAYVAMFGIMFGDVGHGLLLTGFALAVRFGTWPRLARLRAGWPFLAGAGVASVAAGAAYGEFFGPTGLVPALWLQPLTDPMRLLTAGIGVGAALLAASYTVGIVNRWREGGPGVALYAASGVAGAAVFVGLALGAVGLFLHLPPLWLAAAALTLVGLGLAAVGFASTAGGGATGIAQTVVELFDTAVRIGANLVSFARLAAFGLTHAALGLLVWHAAAALAGRGVLGVVAAAVVFLLGNALAIALEGLVAAVQALRLEYYEMFSRIFGPAGRPYRPWRITTEELS